jgi:Family of unknown function (DUF5675)
MSVCLIARRLTDDQGTLGNLVAPRFSCYVLELPKRNDAQGLSCIPAGLYRVDWTLSPRLKIWTYEILDVPGRDGIRMHGGNHAGDITKGYLSDSEGCPLLGYKFGVMQGQRAVLVSQPAVLAFESAMQRKPFALVIKDI